MRIAVGGIHTESSTFNPVLTEAHDFLVRRGEEILTDPRFVHLHDYPAFQYFPTIHARAIPGGPVSREAFEQFLDEHLTALKAALPLDGVYLAMHGAMNVEGMDDAEGVWITKTREVVGPDAFISASYDLHGNLSERIIRSLDAFSTYRTAPHIDVLETTARALKLLYHGLTSGEQLHMAWVPIPVLVPGERSSTEDEPAKSLYAGLEEIDEIPGILDASLLVGYVWADEPRATASVLFTGTDRAVLEREAKKLAETYFAKRHEFVFGTAHGSIEECLEMAKTAPGLAIIGDSGDNPTGGGVGDRANALAAVLASSLTDVLVAGIADQPATDACYAAGVGGTVTVPVGGTLDTAGSEPVTLTGRVQFLTQAENNTERVAVLALANNIVVVLHARRRPFHHFSDFTALNLDIHGFNVLLVKSGYLSPDLRTVAKPALLALTPGVVDQDILRLPYHRWQRPRFPHEADFPYEPRVIWNKRDEIP